MSKVTKKTPESMIKDIRKNTRRIFSSEQKILIVMEGLRAEDSVSELCRKYANKHYYLVRGNLES